MTETKRLSKRLIELIGCSRREAELYIEGGWVTVNDEVIEAPQHPVSTERVMLLANAVALPQEPATLLLHLPRGHASNDPEKHLGAHNHWAKDNHRRLLQQHFLRLNSCLPLQTGAEGLHILTQNWRLKRALQENASKLEQEYLVEVQGQLSASQLKRLNQSLPCEGNRISLCKVSWQSENRLRFALKNPAPDQLLRMCQHLDLKVLGVKRIRVGSVTMTKVPPGQWRYLSSHERF
jgi:23S rRNA pseudouridine2604 synthase